MFRGKRVLAINTVEDNPADAAAFFAVFENSSL
jgi:hypothetical protein